MLNSKAIIEFPDNVIILPGEPGRTTWPVDSSAELVPDFGHDGDHAIILATGAEWEKTGGAWAATGRNYWGTLLQQGADQVQAARDAAETAMIAADASGNAAGTAGGFAAAASGSAGASAGSAAAALASKNAAATSETNAANSASAALASKNAAATSETNAGNSAGAALASKNAAATSETNAAASAAAANVAKMNPRGAYSAGTAYAVRDFVTFGGSAWAAKVATTGNAPPTLPATSNTWWDLFVQKGDVYEEYAISIYKAANIDLGGYYADRSTSAACTLTKLYGEVVAGDIGSQVDFYLSINGALAYGPVTAIRGTPVDLTGLAIAVPAGAKVSYVVTYMTGNVSEFFAKSYGAVA